MPTTLHGIIQFLIAMLLERAGWHTASEVRLKVVHEAQPVPDVIAVRGKLRGPYPTTAPELCVDILSPSDTLDPALKKASAYVSWGSRAVWIIDREKRTAWTLAGGEPQWIPPSGTLRIDDTAIDLGPLFAEVDNRLEHDVD